MIVICHSTLSKTIKPPSPSSLSTPLDTSYLYTCAIDIPPSLPHILPIHPLPLQPSRLSLILQQTTPPPPPPLSIIQFINHQFIKSLTLIRLILLHLFHQWSRLNPIRGPNSGTITN